MFYEACLGLRPVWPMYRLLQVLHFILFIPLFVYLSLFFVWDFRRFCFVLLTRYVIFRFVFLKILVTFLIMVFKCYSFFVVLCLCII
jgi:hypothetical protein